MKKVVIGILVIAIITVVVGLVPIMEIQHEEIKLLAYDDSYSYVERADNRANRARYCVDVLSSVDSDDINAINEAINWAYSIPEYNATGHVSVKNEDQIQGTFKVETTFYSGGKEYAEERMLLVQPGQTEEVVKSTDIDYDKEEWSWAYNVTPPTKVVTYDEKVPIFEWILSKF